MLLNLIHNRLNVNYCIVGLHVGFHAYTYNFHLYMAFVEPQVYMQAGL